MKEYNGDDCSLETFAGTWEKNGNTITVIGEDKLEKEYQIVSVSAIELKLKVGNSATYVFTRS